jgi:hypothetical protein
MANGGDFDPLPLQKEFTGSARVLRGMPGSFAGQPGQPASLPFRPVEEKHK